MWTDPDALAARLDDVQSRDRHRLARALARLRRRPDDAALTRLAEQVERSIAITAARRARVPELSWPALPVVEHRERIAAAIADHQVVVVAGETGSGKTTQLPKICLELGRGVRGMIGHTQPRRLAARAVASRLADELGTTTGDLVGYRVRFTDQVSEHSLVKLMTDGMLLAEMQQDPFFSRYDTLIIDEAHERSLNIDFLLGYLRRLLPKRPDLKLIITSATIDHERIAAHFGNAPVLEVSGRSWPVTIHYRPPEGERELSRQVEDVLHEIERREREHGRPPACDVLVFLAGEREIRDVHHHLRRCDFRDTEFLPLYARLSSAEQQRIFRPHRGRRVVLSTNVAETSLTVPGIRYVIDAGTVRMSRYSVHGRVQRLPVEPVSCASADQRAGRSGRIMPGDCFRLYSEEDYLARPAFTDPEILRTSLAAVILRMADLRLGEVESFPFLDAPEQRQVRDGYRLLEEVNAWQDGRLTPVGRQLARLPVDPGLGRMMLAAAELHCLREVLVIVAALSVQDPRERPPEAQQAADQAHQPFVDRDSDFLFFVNLWQWCESQREALSRSQYEKLLRKHFLSPIRVREWRDVHHQLTVTARELKLPFNDAPGTFEQIHRALLSGLLGNVLKRTEEGDWLSVRSRKLVPWPGSALAKTKANWLMAAEQVETSRLFARTLARIEPEWIEQQGRHLLRYAWLEPYWSRRRGALMAKEQVSLFGLIIRSGRRVHYGPREPALAREMMIREGLVAGELNREPEFVRHNRELIERLADIEHRLRRRDLLVDEESRVAFYEQRIPPDLYTLTHLESWYRRASPAEREALRMTEAFLLGDQPDTDQQDHPDWLELDGVRLPLEYRFDPQGNSDGVTVVVPVQALPMLDASRLEWLVPGLLRQKMEALIRGLPKSRRRAFVPVPDYVRALHEVLEPGRESLLDGMTRALQRMTGVRVEREEWPVDTLPPHLRFLIRVTDGDAVLAESRDLAALQKRFAGHAPTTAPEAEAPATVAGREWVFGELPAHRDVMQHGVQLRTWPALRDESDRVALVQCRDAASAGHTHRLGVARLIAFRLGVQVRELETALVRHAAVANLVGRSRERREKVLARLVLDHFRSDLENVRSGERFEQVLEAGRADFLDAALAQLAKLDAILTGRDALAARLKKNFPLAWAHAHRDIGAQLDGLFRDDWLLDVPADWLREYPRYLDAIGQRLERLGGRLGQDRAHTVELEHLYAQLYQRAGDRPLWQWPEPLLQYRFMLEEYRVSLFAQQLGTRLPVSAKRLRQQWENC